MESLKSLFLLGVLLVSFQSFGASGYQGFSIMTPFNFEYLEFDQDEQNSDIDHKFNTYRMGYTTASGLYLGAFYDYFKSKSTLAEDREYRAWGASLGYARNGFFLVGQATLDGSLILSQIGRYKNAKGFGIDMGYSFEIGMNFNIGAQLTFRGTMFDELENIDLNPSRELTVSYFFPALVLGTTFR